MVVMENPTACNANSLLAWLARLRGTLVVQPGFFDGKQPSVCVKFTRATRVRRHIWISQGFHEHHGPYVGVAKDVVAQGGSKWAIIDRDVDSLKQAKSRLKKGGMAVMGLATSAELRADVLKHAKHVFNGPGFLDAISHVECVSSALSG